MAKPAKVRTESGQWADLALQVPDLTSYAYLPTTPVSGFRNKIINGNFDIWQRGTSFSSAGYTADRWSVVAASGQTVAVTQQTFTPGNTIYGYEPAYFLRTVWSGTPSGTFWLTQKLEDVRTFAGQTITLSFWAKASSATSAFSPTIEQNFGSGGSSGVTVGGTAISLTTSWQKFSQSFSVPSISGKTIGTSSFLEIRPFNAGTSVNGNNIDLWGVQVEAGSIATPFEQRPVGLEEQLCQRYYTFVSEMAFNGGVYGSFTFPTSMRVTPTITPTGGAVSGSSRTGWHGISGGTTGFNYTAVAEL